MRLITDKEGFTLIEIIVTIVVIGIIMVPLAFILMESVLAARAADVQAISANLTDSIMANVNQLPGNFSPNTRYNYPNYLGYGLDLILTTGTAYLNWNYGGTNYSYYPLELGVYPAGSCSLTNVPLSLAYLRAVNIEWAPTFFGKGSSRRVYVMSTTFATDPVTNPPTVIKRQTDSDSKVYPGSASYITPNTIKRIPLQNLDQYLGITLVGVSLVGAGAQRTLTSFKINGVEQLAAGSSYTIPPSRSQNWLFVPFAKPYTINPGGSFTGNSGAEMDFVSIGTNRFKYDIYIVYDFSDGSYTPDCVIYQYKYS